MCGPSCCDNVLGDNLYKSGTYTLISHVQSDGSTDTDTASVNVVKTMTEIPNSACRTNNSCNMHLDFAVRWVVRFPMVGDIITNCGCSLISNTNSRSLISARVKSQSVLLLILVMLFDVKDLESVRRMFWIVFA